MHVIVQQPKNDVQIGPEALVLVADNWNDYNYHTTYNLWYRTPGLTRELGIVKIAYPGQKIGPAPLPAGGYKTGLPGEFFSVGQSDLYYENIRRLGNHKRIEILETLHDLAYFPHLMEVAKPHEVTNISLLRSVEEQTVRVQFHRIARGGVRLTEYRFKYFAPGESQGAGIEFHVIPEIRPSSNIHVLIGRNGVGKTTLLRNLARAVVHPHLGPRFGTVAMLPTSARELGEGFTNVVSVTFSAFDPFTGIYTQGTGEPHNAVASYKYVGLHGRANNSSYSQMQSQHEQLQQDFSEALREVFASPALSDWREAMLKLSSDPQFAVSGFATFASEMRAGMRLGGQTEQLTSEFSRLSSGHAIVVLTMTELVHKVAERSLVLLDEPEAHLHPPLLASFMQALSKLLTDRNGVAIVATHSPVVLQAVPRSCVYKLIRHGETSRTERPQLETYGESVGALTHEVFGLEVMQSGFYAEITQAVASSHSYDEVLEHFGGQLGSEAKGLVRILLAEKNRAV